MSSSGAGVVSKGDEKKQAGLMSALSDPLLRVILCQFGHLADQLTSARVCSRWSSVASADLNGRKSFLDAFSTEHLHCAAHLPSWDARIKHCRELRRNLLFGEPSITLHETPINIRCVLNGEPNFVVLCYSLQQFWFRWRNTSKDPIGVCCARTGQLLGEISASEGQLDAAQQRWTETRPDGTALLRFLGNQELTTLTLAPTAESQRAVSAKASGVSGYASQRSALPAVLRARSDLPVAELPARLQPLPSRWPDVTARGFVDEGHQGRMPFTVQHAYRVAGVGVGRGYNRQRSQWDFTVMVDLATRTFRHETQLKLRGSPCVRDCEDARKPLLALLRSSWDLDALTLFDFSRGRPVKAFSVGENKMALTSWPNTSDITPHGAVFMRQTFAPPIMTLLDFATGRTRTIAMPQGVRHVSCVYLVPDGIIALVGLSVEAAKARAAERKAAVADASALSSTSAADVSSGSAAGHKPKPDGKDTGHSSSESQATYLDHCWLLRVHFGPAPASAGTGSAGAAAGDVKAAAAADQGPIDVSDSVWLEGAAVGSGAGKAKPQLAPSTASAAPKAMFSRKPVKRQLGRR